MSEWRGLANPEWHDPNKRAKGWAWCEGDCNTTCHKDELCRCCLAAEVERLTAELAEREAVIQRVRDELQGVTVALAQGCLCQGDECSGRCGRGTPWAWNLDPERIERALGGESDE